MTQHQLDIWQKLAEESESNLEARIKFDKYINDKFDKQITCKFV